MVRCPKCGSEIDYLNYYAYELTKACVSIDENYDQLDYYSWDSLGVTKGEIDYECPECGEVLFHTEKEAEQFLRQKQTATVKG